LWSTSRYHFRTFIIFDIYINDIFKVLPKGELVSFADDTSIFIKDKSWEEVLKTAENKIALIAGWLKDNYLSLNIDKTVFITFGSYADRVPKTCELKIHKINCTKGNCNCPKINRVVVTKYLGVYIDQHLKWKHHLLQLTQKLRYLIFIFYKMKSLLNIKQLLIIYHGLFWSVATYGIIAWGGVYENTLQPLLNVQKTIVKMIFKKKKSYPSEQLYREHLLINIKRFYIEKSIMYNFANLQNQYKQIKNVKRTKTIIPQKTKKVISMRKHNIIGLKAFNMLSENLKISYVKKQKNDKMFRKFICNLSRDNIKEIFSI